MIYYDQLPPNQEYSKILGTLLDLIKNEQGVGRQFGQVLLQGIPGAAMSPDLVVSVNPTTSIVAVNFRLPQSADDSLSSTERETLVAQCIDIIKTSTISSGADDQFPTLGSELQKGIPVLLERNGYPDAMVFFGMSSGEAAMQMQASAYLVFGLHLKPSKALTKLKTALKPPK